MKDLLNLSITDIIKKEKSSTSFNNEILIVELNNKIYFKQETHTQIKAFSVVLLCRGEMNININGTAYLFNSQTLLDLLDLHVFQNIKVSPDFKAYHVIIDKDFFFETMRGIKSLPLSNFLSRCDYPAATLREEECNLLENIILRIIQKTALFNHQYQRDLIKNELRSLLMEMANMIILKKEEHKARISQNKEDIVAKFVHLLNIHCKEKHNVEFYAQELCIDAKYLSRILKSFSGETAAAWIDNAILKEVKIYLSDPRISIQQIAEMFNYSDQSAFGKFFKKRKGISPLRYRETLLCYNTEDSVKKS